MKSGVKTSTKWFNIGDRKQNIILLIKYFNFLTEYLWIKYEIQILTVSFLTCLLKPCILSTKGGGKPDTEEYFNILHGDIISLQGHQIWKCYWINYKTNVWEYLIKWLISCSTVQNYIKSAQPKKHSTHLRYLDKAIS